MAIFGTALEYVLSLIRKEQQQDKQTSSDVAMLRSWIRLRFSKHAIPMDFSVNEKTGRVESLWLDKARHISPVLVRKLDKLKVLTLMDSKVPSESKVLSRIAHWKSLKELRLLAPVSADLLRSLSDLSALETVELAWFSAYQQTARTDDLSSLRALPNLRVLSMRCRSRSTHTEISPVFDLINLEELALENVSVSPKIGQLQLLKKFSMAGLPSIDHIELCLPLELRRCEELRELSLFHCHYLVTIPPGATGFPKLTKIEVSYPAFLGLDYVDYFGAHTIAEMGLLTSLKLNGLRLGSRYGTLRDLFSLVQQSCTNLELLALNDNEIADLDEFSDFGRHAELRELSLTGNLVVMRIPSAADQRLLLRILERNPALTIRLVPSHFVAPVLVDLLTPESLCILDRNASGRRLLVPQEPGRDAIPLSLWPTVLQHSGKVIERRILNDKLANRTADVLYYMLRNGPALAARMSFR